jgi:GNAT superfamily N-acetyltransferase
VIRPFHADDAEAVAALLDEDPIPEGVTGDGIRHWLASQPERARAAVWVADEEGGIAGWARARLRWATSVEGVGEVTVLVSPRLRRRGLGAALYDRAHAHLVAVGARLLESWTTDEQGDRFLVARAFRPVRTQMLLRLDVASADLSAFARLREAKGAEGYELVPLAAVADRAKELYALDAGATADVPGTFREDDVRLEDWLDETLGHPQLTREGSFVVLAGGQPVAHALLHVAPSSRLAANEMTGTRPEHRRKGLARLAKLACIAWAREHGYDAIQTGCDQDNAGMLHLNQTLGYEQIGTETQYLREDLR